MRLLIRQHPPQRTRRQPGHRARDSLAYKTRQIIPRETNYARWLGSWGTETSWLFGKVSALDHTEDSGPSHETGLFQCALNSLQAGFGPPHKAAFPNSTDGPSGSAQRLVCCGDLSVGCQRFCSATPPRFALASICRSRGRARSSRPRRRLVLRPEKRNPVCRAKHNFAASHVSWLFAATQ